jgi:general secretion pathway protein N
MRRFIAWLLAAALTMALSVVVFCPAAWLSYLLEQQTGGRLTLGDAQGTLWRGSAFVGGAPGKSEAVTPLLAGRFSWRISPALLFGRVDVELENTSALSQMLTIRGTWSQWQVGPAAVELPAERLSGLGAPLNTIEPTGQMKLSWGPLLVQRQSAGVAVNGTMNLDLENIASRLSPINPLGAYQVALVWSGVDASLVLKTSRGPLLLSGSGALANGRFHFSGFAEAEVGQEQKLANLLNLLGQHQKNGNKDVFALKL